MISAASPKARQSEDRLPALAGVEVAVVQMHWEQPWAILGRDPRLVSWVQAFVPSPSSPSSAASWDSWDFWSWGWLESANCLAGLGLPSPSMVVLLLHGYDGRRTSSSVFHILRRNWKSCCCSARADMSMALHPASPWLLLRSVAKMQGLENGELQVADVPTKADLLEGVDVLSGAGASSGVREHACASKISSVRAVSWITRSTTK